MLRHSLRQRLLYTTPTWIAATGARLHSTSSAPSSTPSTTTIGSGGGGDAATSTMTTNGAAEIPADLVHVEATTPPKRKLQVAVVGSGPSGCYVADYLTKKHPELHVDVYEKLPVPFGLLRYGVAPDHPEVKNLEMKFKELFRSQRATWIGNVNIGRDLTIEQLLQSYTAVIVSTGANQDKMLGIPGEGDLGNVFGAREFVNYYNTYPFPNGSPLHCPFQFQGGPTGDVQDVVVIGNGNVAIDVTRVLASSYKYWCPTDMNCNAVKALMENRIRNIHVVARRGVEHSAFTIAEFRELTTYRSHNHVHVAVDQFDLQSALALPSCQTRAKKRLLELVHKYAGQQVDDGEALSAPTSSPSSTVDATNQAPPQGKASKLDRGPCTVHFQYHMRPVELLPHPKHRHMVGGVRFERTAVGGGDATTSTVVIPCQVVLKSIGYASEPLPGVAFNEERRIVDNIDGRVRGQDRLYCSGWCKRGATGVILHTMADAHATAQSVLNDLANGVLKQTAEHNGKYGLIERFVAKNMFPTSIHALERIWKVEEERGIDLGKRWEKVAKVSDMMDLSMGGKLGKKAHNRVRGIANGRPDALMYLAELLDDDTDLRPFAQQLARELPFLMSRKHEGINPKELQ